MTENTAEQTVVTFTGTPWQQRIALIKAVRFVTGLGLKDAKDVVVAVLKHHAPEKLADVTPGTLSTDQAMVTNTICVGCGRRLVIAGSFFCHEGCYSRHRRQQAHVNRLAHIDTQIADMEYRVKDLRAERERCEDTYAREQREYGDTAE